MIEIWITQRIGVSNILVKSIIPMLLTVSFFSEDSDAFRMLQGRYYGKTKGIVKGGIWRSIVGKFMLIDN